LRNLVVRRGCVAIGEGHRGDDRYAVLFEVFIAGRHNPEIRRELAELYDAARRHVPSIKELGLGNAVAIALDATLVRLVLVPAAMQLMGRWNWWLPGWLDRLLPDLGFESGPKRAPAGKSAPAGA
jgi:hypothetical protein